MVAPDARREAVAHLRVEHVVSERRARLAKVPSAKPMEGQTRGAGSLGQIGHQSGIFPGVATIATCARGCVRCRRSVDGLGIDACICCCDARAL